jgi:hypothetical protein
MLRLGIDQFVFRLRIAEGSSARDRRP